MITILGVVSSLLILVSAAAHAFLGWPAMAEGLAGRPVDADLVGALAVGWHFGSVCMAVFGVIVGHQALRRARGKSVESGALWTIAGGYLLFGLVAWVARDLNPQFLVFVATGLLVGAFALLDARERAGM